MNIGHLNFKQPLILAPMEDISDQPFRVICRRLGADLVFTEFTSSEALIRDIPKAKAKIAVSEEERPVAVQLFGSNPYSMCRAAEQAMSVAPDIIDINCGCWSKTHALRGEGAGLLKNLPLLSKIVSAVVATVPIPVTVKTRLGWDINSINILDTAQIIEQAGAKALTVHCRTRSQGYKGIADWDWLPTIKKSLAIPLIGNGDIKTPHDVKTVLEKGCDGVMIGRGAVTNPWIFAQAKHYLGTGKILPAPGLKERVNVCLQHLALQIQDRGPKLGILTFRKFYAGYLHGYPYSAKIRAKLMTCDEHGQITEALNDYVSQAQSRTERTPETDNCHA